MFSFFILAFSAVCSAQATSLVQQFKNVHLSAKVGKRSDFTPPPDHLQEVDQYATGIAEKYVQDHMDLLQTVMTYGPIEDVVIPGITLSGQITLKNIVFNGLNQLQVNGIQWHVASNRLKCNATLPKLLVEVTFDNVEIQLDSHEKFNTGGITVRVSFTDLKIIASARYKPDMNDLFRRYKLLIDKAEVDISANEIVIEIKTEENLEENVLKQIFNSPLQDILDTGLKVILEEINENILKRTNSRYISKYLIANVPEDLKLNKAWLVITNSVW